MPQSNLDLIRKGIEAFNRGDFEGAIADYDENAEWYPHVGAVDRDVFRGRDAIKVLWREIHEHLSGFRVDPEELIDLGEQAICVIHATGTGGGSGAGVEDRWAQLYTLRQGKILKVEAFDGKDEALGAAGE